MAGQAHYTLGEADYVAANVAMTARNGLYRWYLWIGAAAGALSVANIGLEILGGRSVGSALLDFLVMLVVSMALLAAYFGRARSIRKQVRRMLAQRSALTDPVACSWSNSGIVFAGSDGTADLKWCTLHRWFADDVAFVFLVSDRLMMILPKRTLSAELAEDLHFTIKQYHKASPTTA